MAISNPVLLAPALNAGTTNQAILTTTLGAIAGTLAVIALRSQGSGNTLNSVTDTAGNTWKVIEPGGQQNTSFACIAYSLLTADLPAGSTVTATMNSSQAGLCAVLFEAQTPALVDPADSRGNRSTGTATSATTVNTGALNITDELIIGVTAHGSNPGTYTPGGSFTLLGSVVTGSFSLLVSYQVVSSNASVAWSPSWVNNILYTSVVVSFMGRGPIFPMGQAWF